MTSMGVDLVQIKRFEELLNKNNHRHWEDVYTKEELAKGLSHVDPCAYFATRFAAKEAVFKALAVEWDEAMAWRQIEVMSYPSGCPYISLAGRFLQVFTEIGAKQISLSLSWDNEYAIAVAAIS